MKKSAKKVKAVKRSEKSQAPETEMPDLIAVMLKLTERLEAVERKMDLVVSQTVNRQPFQQNQPRPQHIQHNQPQHNAPQHSQHQSQQFNQPPRHNQNEQNFNRAPQQRPHPQPQNQNPQNQNRGPQHGGKPMFQAVCADCKKNCEVPFRPSGERPTYCKECYSKRKAPGNFQKPNDAPNFSPMEKRQLKVVSNGVGKTTISEMVPAAPRAASAKKNSKPAKKSKK